MVLDFIWDMLSNRTKHKEAFWVGTDSLVLGSKFSYDEWCSYTIDEAARHIAVLDNDDMSHYVLHNKEA